jgi:hypothetical protein
MKLYTYSTARQSLAEVLEEASREGEVPIRRQDGRVYAVTPVEGMRLREQQCDFLEPLFFRSILLGVPASTP